jgi:hypothetical protein
MAMADNASPPKIPTRLDGDVSSLELAGSFMSLKSSIHRQHFGAIQTLCVSGISLSMRIKDTKR